MANEDHIAQLKLALEKGDIELWNKWRLTNASIIPDLNSADLRNADLSNAALGGSSLDGAMLNRARLAGARLSGAMMSHSILADANLSGADLRGANLSGADLRRTDLANAMLSGANVNGGILIRARLAGARLDGANMSGSILMDADLHRADLSCSNLTGAALIRAKLSSADLSEALMASTTLIGADLSGSRLNNTHFDQAWIGWTVFADVDLSNARGLDSIVHMGPSSIGIDTIYRSLGSVSEIFLRGAGVPTPFIRLMPSIVGSSGGYHSCFICYSHEDKVFALRLHNSLQERGICCWLDEKQTQPAAEMNAEDRKARFEGRILLCASRASLSSWWIDKEIVIAEDSSTRILMPVSLDGFMSSMELKNAGSGSVLSRMVANFSGWETDDRKFVEQLEKVVMALQR